VAGDRTVVTAVVGGAVLFVEPQPAATTARERRISRRNAARVVSAL
jgi:hypothetical protein